MYGPCCNNPPKIITVPVTLLLSRLKVTVSPTDKSKSIVNCVELMALATLFNPIGISCLTAPLTFTNKLILRGSLLDVNAILPET